MANKKNLRKGWFNPYQYNKNTYFDEDYEEPTYLSFKLEFGNWGASINDDEADRILWEVQDKQYQTYDDLPMGLFNPNFSIPDSESYDSKLENVSHYSAVEYLYRRNEDTRAEYLQAFIKGWYDLQKNYQFYFQEISGVSKLFVTDTKKGLRLEEGTKITVKCLEDSLDQRIRYLLTLYRKAAWDDNWQRWILPDIYRYFHMYIYISENRLFHAATSDFLTKTNEDIVTGSEENISYPNNDYNNIQILTNLAENITADNYAQMVISSATAGDVAAGTITTNVNSSLTLAALNGFAPVTVLDCGPCEFDITSVGIYNDNYKINQPDRHEISFNVIVKNVHFYEKNPLMWRLTNDVTDSEAHENGLIFVKDLYNTSERQKYNNTVNSFPKYIDQSFYNNDEILQFLTPSEGNDEIAGDHFKAIQNMLSLYSALWEGYNQWNFSPATNPDDDGTGATFNTIFNALKQEMIRNKISAEALLGISGWNLTNYSTQIWGALNEDLWNLYNTMQVNYERMVHNWQYFDEIYEQTLGDRSWATEFDGGPWGRLQGADLRAWIPRQDFIWPDMRSFIEDQNFVWPDLTADIPEQDLTPMDMTAVIIHQNMTSVDGNVEIPEQQMIGIDQPEDRSWATEFDGWHPENDSNNNLEQNRDLLYEEDINPKLVNIGIEQPKDRSWATEFDGWHPENDSDKDKMVKLKDNIEIPNQNMTPLEDEIEIPDQQMAELEFEEYEAELKNVPLDNTGYTKPKIKNVSPEGSYTPKNVRYVSLIDSSIPTEDMTPLELPDYEYNMDMTPMEYDQYNSPKLINIPINGSTDISNATAIRNVSPDLSDYNTPDITNVNGEHIIIPNRSPIDGTAADLDLESKPNTQIKDVRLTSDIQSGEMNMTELLYDSIPPTEIKDVNVDMHMDTPKDIKDVHVDQYNYRNPEIKNVSPDINGYISPKIKEVTLENSIVNSEIKEVTLQESEVNQKIKDVTVEPPVSEIQEIRPISITDSINNSEMKPVTVLNDSLEDLQIKNVSLEDTKYTFTGDLTRLDYSNPKPAEIKPVNLETPKKKDGDIEGPELYPSDVNPKIKDIRINPEKRNPKIRNVELEKAPDKNNTAELLHGILELEKENKKLIAEVNRLKEQILSSKMVSVQQPTDRSWATEFDGWPPKEDSDKDTMIGIEKPKKNKNKKTIQGPKLML